MNAYKAMISLLCCICLCGCNAEISKPTPSNDQNATTQKEDDLTNLTRQTKTNFRTNGTAN